jgi:histidine triad (HIT) family protein
MATIFSKIISREIPGYIVAENDRFIAFLDVFPLAKGHTLVVPKKEIDYIFDLDDASLSGIILFSKDVARAVEKVVPCKRIGIAVVGLEVPHAHIHLIPLKAVHDIDFSRPKLKIENTEMASIAALIKEQFNAAQTG